MKPSGQYRADVGDPVSLSRGSSQHVNALTTTGPGGHPVYLAQHQSLGTHLPGFVSQSSGGSPHGPGPGEYHAHHLQPGELPHRGHLSASAGIGINPGHVPMHMPQRRRTSGHRLSLLWDIGVAGERERDRVESSASSILSHSFTTTAAGGSHVITGPVVYGGRPNMSMMSSLGGLQASQRNLASSSVAGQPPPGTPPRHSASAGQLSRSSTSIHAYPGGSSPFMLPGPSSIKTEPGTFVKEESKSPMHSVTHYPQMVHPQSFSSHPTIRTPTQSDQSAEKETENMPSKECLLQSMDKVDKEINKIASEIKVLERKKHQLETAAKKPPQTEKSASPKKVETKHKDLWQVIYAENKRKAEAARGLLDHLCHRYDMPLYNQPSDTKVYQDNLKKNEEMRPKLLAYFQRRSQLSNIRERYLCARYDLLMTEWQRKADRIENSVKRKTKEAKVREFFEKQFPEIRKQREQQERFTRSGTRGDACRSEADFNEIVDGLSEQENQEQHMRQLAVVPPMLLDRDERRLKFINNNGLVTDPFEDYKKRQELDHWSEQEKEIFKEKYVQHPKNFHLISQFLEKKSVNDCVLYYYLSKKKAGYKNLVRKNTLKTRKVKPVRGQTQQSAGSNSSGQVVGKNGQPLDKGVGDKYSGQKGDSLEGIVKEEEVERIDRPPSPRITRSRNKNMNWTDEDIVMAKEGFGKHGKDFAAISRLFPNKTELQIKHFYTHYKKKHNLDQLISDGKKKKPEGRRTRTQAQNSESSSSTPPDSESPSAEVSRPRSADPQLSTDQPEPSKKRKKELDSEKKEEQKVESVKVQVESTAVTTPQAESVSVPPRVTSSSTSQIRTRRSAGASSVDSVKAQAGKRSSESSPVEEPVEKRPRKAKQAKETKTENKEPPSEEKKVETPVKVRGKTEAQAVPEEKVSTHDETPPKEPEEPPVSESKAVANVVKAATVADSENQPPASTTTLHTESHATNICLTKAEMTVASSPTPTPVTHSKPSQPATPEKLMKEQVVQPSLPSPSQQPTSVGGNDGDSSATCSADEEPNLQDVEMKATARKHTDSPYAFEDDSSASIKLETLRAPMPPISSAPSPQMKEAMPARSTASYDGRPASTHPPQPVIVKVEDNRPQSLPPPPGAIPSGTVPISALSFQPPFQKQTPPSHIVGKVPDAQHVRLALQTINIRPVSNAPPLVAVPHSRPQKQIASELCQTIDLTGASTSADDSSKIAREPPQRFPPYHPVPQEATSLQKDFLERKVDFPPREEFSQRHREYTPSDLASMRDRAAVLPIPVSSLRAPMPGMVQRKEVPRQEQNVKKEIPPPPSEMITPIKHLATPIGHNPMVAHNPPSLARPHVTTSSVPTKIISRSMTSGAPLRQNQPNSSHTPGLPIHSEGCRSEVISPHQTIHHQLEPAVYRRSPIPEPALLSHVRSYPDVTPKTSMPGSRSSIVKVAGNVPALEPAVVTSEERKGKSGPGSITTGLPVHRSHEDRPEQRTAVIAGKQVVVKQPLLEQARLQELERQQHSLRFPPGLTPGHPMIIGGLPQKSLQAAGSILEGRPVVKRKTSDESNSSLSPSGNPAPYPGVMVSRPSPTAVTTAPRLPERTQVPLDRNMGALHTFYTEHLLADRAAKEEFYRAPHHTPEKLVRDSAGRVPSPSHRQTPTGSLAQHPAVKQELPSSPHTAEEFLRAQQAVPLGGLPLLDFHRSMPGNPLGLPPIPLTTPGVSQDFFEILRQYQQSPSRIGLPLLVAPQAPYPGLLNPAASPLPPGSPQKDDGRETTKKMLNQDFKTAQLMSQLRQPAQVTVPATYTFLPGATAPAIVPPPLLAGAASPYRHMAAGYAGLPVDRLNFIPTHPFAPHIPPQSGRSSAESRRSPSHKLPRSLTPETERHRHRSSEPPSEFSNHPVIKERNSPSSPYRSPRGNDSPQRYVPPAPPQLSPSHLSQLPAKPYRGYPHSNTPPMPSAHHRSIQKSSHLPPGVHPPYIGHETSSFMGESRSPLLKHSRSGSHDGSMHQSFERVRPGSASPHPRSLPQSPNDLPEQPSKYSAHIRHAPSPKYRHEQKLDALPVHVITNEQKLPVRDERQMPQHRDNTRSTSKHLSERGNGRIQQHAAMAVGAPQVPVAVPSKHETGSPIPFSSVQQKERLEQPPKDKIPSKPEHRHSPRNSPSETAHVVSSNPGADLKKSGRTKMKAATLIDHIINMNFDVSSPPKTPEPQPSKSTGPSQVLPGSSRSSDASKRPAEELHSSKREVTPSKPIGFETEAKSSVLPAHAYQPHPFSTVFTPSPANQQNKDKNPSSKTHVNHGLTFAKHSADVIDKCYREATPAKKGSPVRMASPVPPKSAVMVTEPISPPEKRVVSGRAENKPPSLPASYQPFLSQQRFLAPISETVAQPSVLEQSRAFATSTRPPASLPVSQGGTLEEIIRKALMNGEQAPSDSQQSRSKPAIPVLDGNLSSDMILSQAVLASMAAHRGSFQQEGHGALAQKLTPPLVEERKGTPPAAQPQSGSEKYMSALMFRTPTQNATPPASERQQQPFYQAQARAPAVGTSQSPVPQEANPSQCRPGKLPMPQYEALSDSD